MSPTTTHQHTSESEWSGFARLAAANDSGLFSQLALASELYIFLGQVTTERGESGTNILKMASLCSRLINGVEVQRENLVEGLQNVNGASADTAEKIANLVCGLHTLLTDLSDTELFLPGISPIFSLGILSSTAASTAQKDNPIDLLKQLPSWRQQLQNSSLNYAEDLIRRRDKLRQAPDNDHVIRRLVAESAITSILSDRLEMPNEAAAVLVYAFGVNDLRRAKWVGHTEVAMTNRAQLEHYKIIDEITGCSIISNDKIRRYSLNRPDSHQLISFNKLKEHIRFIVRNNSDINLIREAHDTGHTIFKRPTLNSRGRALTEQYQLIKSSLSSFSPLLRPLIEGVPDLNGLPSEEAGRRKKSFSCAIKTLKNDLLRPLSGT